MTKRPEKDEFLASYNNVTTETEADRIQQLAIKYNVTTRCIYNWIEVYNHELETDVKEETEKSFFDWMEDYHEELPQQKVLEHTVSLKGDPLIICLSDLHIGTKFLYRKELSDWVKEWLKHDNVYFIVVGDVIDYGPDGPKDLISEQQVLYKTQRKIALTLADTIGHKVLATCSGCHSHFDLDGVPIEEEFAEKTVSKIFLHDGGILNIKIGDQIYKIFMTHKTRGGSYKNQAQALMKVNESELDFDIGVEAHKHRACITSTVRRQKTVTFINCGSMKGMDSFANRKGFTPLPIAVPAFKIFSKKRCCIPYLDWRDAV